MRADADSAGAGSTSSDSTEADRIERLLLEYTDADPGFESDVGDVEFTDCSPIGDVEYEGHPAFYCEAGNDSAVASLCVARAGDQLFFSAGKLMCEDPPRARLPLRALI
jgi:hypothetical protein